MQVSGTVNQVSAVLPYSEACERNKTPILNVLKDTFATTKAVLEIGSGTGQHAAYFAKNLPHLIWQPSDQPSALKWITHRVQQEGSDNVNMPLALDVSNPPWEISTDGIFSANTLHIMSWQEVERFFSRVAEVLQEPGRLCVYGPFRYDGRYTSESNARFDRSLHKQAAHMGLRDFEAVDELALTKGLSLTADYPMPANNQILVWQR